ncbi:carboxypeptidase regulatory-like domain-containing protein [Archangium sp.]|uniref:carboxypeptidase regulatory-like domain-containing protein n=1 Tax=Archangium sp. TaxID=1872627 RepID=UPI00389A8386
MDRKRTVGLLFVVLVLVGGLFLLLRGSGGEPKPEASRTGGATAPAAPAPARAETPPAPEPAHAAPSRLVPATSTEDKTEPRGSFEGRVISATTGEGVEGAELTFAGEGGATSARTDAEGRFRLVLNTPGTWQLAVVTARGYLPFGPEWGQSPVRFTAVPGQRISDLVLALTPEVELLGRVEDAQGQPVQGAQVRVLTGRGGESVLFPTPDLYTSDAKGEFRFHAPEGAAVEARHPAHASARAEVTRTAMLTRKVVLKLVKHVGLAAAVPGKPLEGLVVDESGAAVTGALVSVSSAASAWPRRYGDELGYERVTDAEGRFSVEDLAPGKYDVTARLMGLAPGQLRDVEAGRTDLLLRLSQGTRLVGTVRDGATGKPVPSFSLGVDTRRGPLQRESFVQLSFIDAQGRYSVSGVPPGSYLVQVAAHGYAPAEATVEVPEGSGPVTADFSLERGARMTGRVVEDGTELPLERARITVEGLGAEGALSVRYDALTDAQGNFTLDGLPSGEVSLFVSADKHHSRIISGVTVRGDTTPPRTIELRPTEEGEEPQVELVGIGAVLAAREDALVLGQVFPGGGADEAGLTTGDSIVRINGRPVVELGFTNAVQSIRGPEGSKLVLGVRRAGAVGTEGNPAPVVDITVTRRRLRL